MTIRYLLIYNHKMIEKYNVTTKEKQLAIFWKQESAVTAVLLSQKMTTKSLP